MDMLLLLLALNAGAETVTAEEMGAMATELMPRVAVAAGRDFEAPPRLEITDVETEWAQVLRPQYRKTLQRVGFEGEALERRLAERRARLETVLAQQRHGTIYVFVDRIAHAHESRGVPSELLRSALYCVLAHELVHVLQFQAGKREVASRAEWERRRVLEEGHAEAVAERICRSRGHHAAVGLMRGMKGAVSVETQVGTPSQLVLRYGYGRAYMAEEIATVGPAGAWQVYDQLPESEAIIERVRQVAPATLTPAMVRAGAAVLEGMEINDTQVDLMGEWRAIGTPAIEAMGRVEAVYGVRFRDPLGDGLLYAVRFEDPSFSMELLDARRALATVEKKVRNQTRVQTATTVRTFAHKAFARDFGVMDKAAENDEALRISYIDTDGSRDPVHAYWVARGSLVVVLRTDTRAGEVSHAQAAKVIAAVLEQAPR